MIKSKLMLCASGIVRDAKSNNISVFNVLEEFKTPGFPLFIPKLCLLNMLERDTDDKSQHDATIIAKINGEEIAELPTRVDFQNKARTRLIITIENFAITKPGRLEFCFVLDGETTGSYAVDISSLQTEKIESDSTPPGNSTIKGREMKQPSSK